MVDPNANTPPYDRALCGALAAAGCHVTLATAPFLYEPLPEPTGYRVEYAFFRLGREPIARRLDLSRRPALRRGLRAAEYLIDWGLLLAKLGRANPDVVHVQWCLKPAVDLGFWRWLQVGGVPIVYTVHNILPHARRRSDAERYRRLYRRADALVVHSQQAAVTLADRFGIAPDRVTVSTHGPLLEEERGLEKADARSRLRLPVSAPLVLFAGRIEPYKGLSDLIEAFRDVAKAVPDARLVIAGRPSEPIQSTLASAGLRDRTHLDLRFLPRADLAAYLCAADVVALPYRETTTSGVLLAARRFGCPVVATAVGDLVEEIEDGRTGLLVPPADPAALAGALRRLILDPSLAARLGEAGQTVLRTRSWEEAARRTVDLYQRLVPHRATYNRR
jgi:glycosyltransferase involved in cell wall biosynthesis